MRTTVCGGLHSRRHTLSLAGLLKPRFAQIDVISRCKSGCKFPLSSASRLCLQYSDELLQRIGVSAHKKSQKLFNGELRGLKLLTKLFGSRVLDGLFKKPRPTFPGTRDEGVAIFVEEHDVKAQSAQKKRRLLLNSRTGEES